MTADTEKLKALALAATPEHEFTDDERRLHDLMSEISEDCWCAGWMHGNEFSLWEAISTGSLKYGMGEMNRDLLAQVAALSVKTGKWIIWRDDQDGLDPHDVSEWGPYAITLKEWADRCAEVENSDLRAEVERLRAEKEQAVKDSFALAWEQALSDAAFYVAGHCANGENHAEIIAEMVAPKLTIGGSAPAAGTEKDAERWRWLRDRHDAGNEQWFVYGAHGELDDSIDAAMKEPS